MNKENPDNTSLLDFKFYAFLGCGLLIFILGTFFLGRMAGTTEVASSSVEESQVFDDVEIRGVSAYVYDSRTHAVLYAKNPDKRLPLASLTKVMSALVASDIAPPESVVSISRHALLEDGDSGLYANERWLLSDLLDFSLTSSSNDGMKATALALGALDKSNPTVEEATLDFVLKMNETASFLNMKNTYFWNVTGLDESEVKGGAYGTARDMAILFDHILRYKPDLLEATREPRLTISSLDGNVHVATNTSYLVSEIPGIKASKTGYTGVAGGNLVVAFDPEVGRPIIISVLGSTAEGRFEDMAVLMKAAMEYIHDKEV